MQIFHLLSTYFHTEHQTFCALFTSPSSSEAISDQESEEGPSRKKQQSASQRKATKTNVATLLHMEGRVTPRAIAYAATLVSSSISDWSSLFMFSLLACLQPACRFTMGRILQQLQLPRFLQLHHRFLRVGQSWRRSTCWPTFEVVESVSLCSS